MANDYQLNPEEFASQKTMIKNHLLEGKSITQLEALKLYGCLRLSAIVFDLRQDGLNIETEKIQVAPRKRVAKYYIKQKDESLSTKNTFTRCKSFRCDDSICWCEVGFRCWANDDKSDCRDVNCLYRNNVKVLK